MRIFLSYADGDRAIAEPIAFSLRSRDHSVFFDKDDLPAGRSYDEQIETAIRQSDVMVFLVSPDSVSKGRYTRTELEFARDTWPTPANRVLPVMVRQTPMADVPAYLKGVTILEPHGNIAAEVASATERLRGGTYAWGAAWRAAAVAAGIFSAGFAVFLALLFAGAIPAPNYDVIGYVLGILLAVGLSAVLVYAGPGWTFKSAIPFLALAAMTFLLPNLAPYLSPAQTISYEPGPEATPDPDKEALIQQIEQSNTFAGLFNGLLQVLGVGLVLTAGILFSAMPAIPGLRDSWRWFASLLTGAIGLVVFVLIFLVIGFLLVGVSLTDDIASMAVIFGLIFAAWAALLGGTFGYWLARGQETT